jgi:hypothetical protein
MTPNPSNRAQTEDWVMVKREPDAAMLAAADRVGNQFAGSDLSSDEMTRAVWAAMLSAAPTISPRGSETAELQNIAALLAVEGKTAEALWLRDYAASLSPRGRGPVDMLVDGDWLRRKVETDPDIDTEAGPSLAAPRGRGEGLEWLERIHNALMTPSMPRQSIGEMAAAGIAALSSAPVSGGGEGKQGLMADPSEHDLVCGDAREGARAAPGEEGQS